ncbi:MAG: 4a-hydroxytetrahydrobiopterin dehydratase [Parachlamydiaceae bacterium]|nr:4a-hydroxytetrahydrobiopterin dehydratase [Parachlamydiaceae bacterium]
MDQNQKSDLAKGQCEPCSAGALALKENEIEALLTKLQSGWNIINGHHLEKKINFPNFVTGLAFTNKLGELAEKEGHHPNIYLTYGLVTVTIWTHKIGGLSKNDFILAAKCDKLI